MVICQGDCACRTHLHDLYEARRTLNVRRAFPGACFHSRNVQRYILVALRRNNKGGNRRLKYGVVISREPAIVRSRSSHESLPKLILMSCCAGRLSVRSHLPSPLNDWKVRTRIHAIKYAGA